MPITTAKVPIVKFEHKQSGLEGDISLYNTLVSQPVSAEHARGVLMSPNVLRLCRRSTTPGCWPRMQLWIHVCSTWDTP